MSKRWFTLLFLTILVIACGVTTETPLPPSASPSQTAAASLTPTELPLPYPPPSPTLPPPTPTSTATQAPPTSTPISDETGEDVGPFRWVTSLEPWTLGEVVSLRVDPANVDYLQLLAKDGYGSLRVRDGRVGQIEAYPNSVVIGVDEDYFIWMVQDSGEAIFASDGGMSDWAFGAEGGWTPVENYRALGGRGVLNDSAGHLWLTTSQDVRRFDGEGWTVFSRQDLTMGAARFEEPSQRVTAAYLTGTDMVWVGECDWGGPGPWGGGGARWFDEQTWYGANSPAAEGCVTAIQEDQAGRVWIGLDGDLLLYDPASGAWERFALPVPPEAMRLGYVIDLVLDSDGNPWPLMSLCGGASCDNGAMRYRFYEGEWIQVGEITDPYGSQWLAFDSTGTPWLFLGNRAYRVENNALEEVAELNAAAVTVDADGHIWIVGTTPGGSLTVWMLPGE